MFCLVAIAVLCRLSQAWATPVPIVFTMPDSKFNIALSANQSCPRAAGNASLVGYPYSSSAGNYPVAVVAIYALEGNLLTFTANSIGRTVWVEVNISGEYQMSCNDFPCLNAGGGGSGPVVYSGIFRVTTKDAPFAKFAPLGYAAGVFDAASTPTVITNWVWLPGTASLITGIWNVTQDGNLALTIICAGVSGVTNSDSTLSQSVRFGSIKTFLQWVTPMPLV